MTFLYLIGALMFLWAGCYAYGVGDKDRNKDWLQVPGCMTAVIGVLYFLIKIIMFWNGH